ncbi:hypothetical protein DOY81_004568 [Sarcophaga bullata]|nr:hypothetical protein DOY81_004568 [Sarcophaga bullata]
MSKSGFSTLNRWLGRKNKDKSMVNGKLSKSSTNLSISSTNINETSQLEYNRITPLPAATTNAPFEQTFRITVLLPKDQLYVTRLGARVPLSKLLELVCDNKLLDAEKYEFRNPVDPSQVYSCDLTIGAVGLSEIRLCHKTESYDNFNSDEIIKLHRTSLIRESLSSSEFSSRNSKHTTKTTSPYSSTNSLNSMDSTALSYSGRPNKLPANTTAGTKMSAPPRKKRAAPRPPSQIAIPEKSALIMENGEEKENAKTTTTTSTTATPTSPLKTKDFSVSSPNLSATSTPLMLSDINGNDCNGHLEEEDYHEHENSSGNGSLNSNGYTEDTVLYAQIQKKNALNLHNQSQVDVERGGDCTDNCSKLPEPSPRKRIVQVKKKTVAPPAPPPRHTLYQDDTVSLASTNASSISTPATPTPKGMLNNSLESLPQDQQPKVLERMDSNRSDIPTPQPRNTTNTTISTSSSNSTSTTLLNATTIEEDLKMMETSTTITSNNNNKTKPNVSKVLLNRTPTPEPRSLSCEPPEVMDSSYDSQMQHFKQQNKTEDDCVSKQADSGIGEPVPSPIPDSLPLEVANLDVKSNFESSSDDDDMVKVYNFKLGKTLVKPLNETRTLEELTVMNQVQEEETDNEGLTPLILNQQQPTPSTVSETSSWNFAIPISPPPNFADAQFNNDLMETKETKPDAPITPKIMERPVLNFEELKQEQEITLEEQQPLEKTESLTTPLDNIVDELTAIIQDKALDTLIKKPEDCPEIEAAKPNTLSNFTINTISQTNAQKPKEIFKEQQTSEPLPEALPKETSETDSITNTVKSVSPLSSPAITSDEEKLYRKRSSITSLKQRRSITRSDSFHTTAASAESLSSNKRTASQLSLDQSTGHLNRRKSSSELSIGESPSLQSLEIIKTILNSRKNSLANSSASEEEPYVEVQARRPSEELKFASLELKMSNQNDMTEERHKTEEPTQQVEEKPKELPKVYRYSGPPSINFSTWNERPKQQVAIKNEGDYIFGGGNPNRTTMPASMNAFTPPLPPPVAPKPGAIQRMGIPEKEYKVPITVKPIQDVVVDQVKQHTTKETEAQQPSKVVQIPKATKETVVSFTADRSILRPASQRPTVESKILAKEEEPMKVNTATVTNQNQKPSLANGDLRYQQQQQQQQRNTITSAKLHLNLKKTTPFTTTTTTTTHINKVNHNEGCNTSSASFTSSSQLNAPSPPALKPKPFSPQTAPALNNKHNIFSNNTTTITPPPPPPPSAPAMITTIHLKPVSSTARSTPTTPCGDPRDQLLDAIRNFNKQGLKKA